MGATSYYAMNSRCPKHLDGLQQKQEHRSAQSQVRQVNTPSLILKYFTVILYRTQLMLCSS